MQFRKTTLSNGIRVLTEHHPYSRSIVIGYWLQTGTRYEKPEQMGLSHLLEHMVFKGTSKYSAYELARSLEARGGDVNAFTSREHTCFHTTSLKEDMDLSVDVLSQLTAFAQFSPQDFEKERKVVEQEIMMAVDDLEEYIFDLYFERTFPANSLGYQILGSPQSLRKIKLADVQNYYNQHFTPQNLIITAAGFVDHDEFVASVEKHLSAKKWAAPTPTIVLETPQPTVVRDFFQKDCEQYHIMVGFPACAYADADRFNSFVLNTALGGGMTSKLYQSIREEHGLAYTVFSMLNTFTDVGIQTIYAGTEQQNVQKTVDLIVKELAAVRDQGLTDEDIDLFKTQAKGQILLGSEDIDNRMNSLAINEMIFGEYRPVDTVILDLNKINRESVFDYIRRKIDLENLSLFVMGSEAEKYKI